MYGKELFIRLTARVFRRRWSNFVCPSFPFGIEGRMWGVIVLIPDHCLSIYFLDLISKYFNALKFCGVIFAATKVFWRCINPTAEF